MRDIKETRGASDWKDNLLQKMSAEHAKTHGAPMAVSKPRTEHLLCMCTVALWVDRGDFLYFILKCCETVWQIAPEGFACEEIPVTDNKLSTDVNIPGAAFLIVSCLKDPKATLGKEYVTISRCHAYCSVVVTFIVIKTALWIDVLALFCHCTLVIKFVHFD